MTNVAQLNTALSGRYEIIRELGQGGMATVYLARDVRHEREVALKVIRDDLSASIGAGRFLREIKIAAQLQHPHILPLLDSGEADGQLFFVMPYVRGQSLRERLARDGELPVHEAVRLLIEIVDALADAHSHGVVHRDIKPDNVMLSGRHALVMDFGVAKAISEATGRNTITTLGVAVGTPTYMSPEQAVADPHIDHRSDIYAVGVMAFEMLTGQAPFAGGTPQQVLAAHVTQVPDAVTKRRPAVPAALDQVIACCLEKRPADRYQSATDLLQALEPLATPSAGITPAETAPHSRRAPGRRWITTVAALVVVAMVGAFGWRSLAARLPAHAAISLGDRKQITFNGRALWTAISDDAKSVAYSLEECAPTGCTYALEVQDVGSPTTRRILSGSVHPLRYVRWSPDRRWIFYDGDVAGENAVGLVSALGGPPVRVAAANVNADFFGADSLVILDRRAPHDILIAGLDGIPRDRVRVVDSSEKLTIGDVMFVPDSRWFIAYLNDSTATARIRVVDRSGRRGSEIASEHSTLVEWASADALWRLIRSTDASDRNVLVRYPFDRSNGRLSAAADTVYSGALHYFDVTRDGTNSIVLSEGSTTYESWAVDLRDALHGQLSADRKLESSTTAGYSAISPDGRRVLLARSQAGRLDASVRPFAGGPAVALSVPDGLALRWIDSVSLMLVEARGHADLVRVIDARTGAADDTLPVPASDAVIGLDRVVPDGWVWLRTTGPMMLQRRGEPKPHVVPLPDNIGAVTSLRTTVDGRQLVLTAHVKAAPDSTVIVVMNIDGSSPVVWARVRGTPTPIMGDRLTGFVQYPSIYALEGPGRVRLVGSVPRSGEISVSADLKRATLTTSEYHGDAWLTKVVRR